MSETLASPKPKAKIHKTMGGKVNIYRRENSNNWQCSTFLNGRNWRVSTHEDSLSRAKNFAEDWYLGLRGKAHAGLLPKDTRQQGKKFKEAAAKFVEEAPVLTKGERGPKWLEQYELKLNRIILPFLGEKQLAEITSGIIQDYRIWRAQNCKTGRLPARSTIHQEIVCIRQVLKNASRHGWIDQLPDMSEPFRPSSKIFHRAWFSAEEYKRLCDATRKRARDPKQPRFRWEAEQLHDYVLFSANTGLRPDEVMRLQFRDVTVVEDVAAGQTILEIEVRGKRGVGYCVSTRGAVRPFERLKTRTRPDGGPGRSGSRTASIAKGEWHEPGPADLLFPKWSRDLFKAILEEENLRTDRDGGLRTAYSLRHTYICFRLLNGANIYQIAKNCRTSVGIIEKHYAAHLRTQLDTTTINTMRPQPTVWGLAAWLAKCRS